MHRLYVTEGIVLGKRGLGEANTLVSILTRELGLVRAKAQSARRERSKLRYGLEPLTKATFSFVRGKYEWKLTGATVVSRELIAQAPADRQAIGRVAKLLLRLVSGEEGNEALYKTAAEGLSALARGAPVETILVLRLLAELGYLPRTPELAPFLDADLFSAELAAEAAASRALLIRSINDSLRATGL